MPQIAEWLGERGSKEELDHIRRGTRQPFESEWVKIEPQQSAEVLHNLGDVPENVQVDYSLSVDGSNAKPANTDDQLFKTITFDPGVLNSSTGIGQDNTVTGARFGDHVLPSAPYDMQNCIAWAWVKSDDTVRIRVFNVTAGQITFTSGEWSLRVLKPRQAEALKADSTSAVTSEKTTTTVTNNHPSETRYFKVRAM